ncbi:MAG: MBL fold metallo-hydrolase [Clostridiales bacterium]|nr:MBL fold metallo-hydrolase [Clostridiales bacterium]
MKEMYPIAGASKAKRICFGSSINVLSWAYMKELREHNKTMAVYEEDPYIEVYQFRDNLYGLFNQNCDGAGDVWMYLIIGPEKSLLIDTAYGLGDCRALAERLSGGKPLMVANTHHHYDHAYGNCRFEKVYCHKYLVPYLEHQDAHMWDYLFDEKGKNIWLEFDRDDLPKFRPYEIVGVEDGYEFDLGDGYKVELIWTAGHAAGHAMFLDKTNRILFAGDDVCSDICGVGGGPKPDFDPYGQYCNIETFRNRLYLLTKRMDEFDSVFPSHFVVDLESRLLLDMLDTCDEILKDPQNYDYKVERVMSNGGTRRVRMHKAIRNFSSVAYTMQGVYAPDSTDRNETDKKERR